MSDFFFLIYLIYNIPEWEEDIFFAQRRKTKNTGNIIYKIITILYFYNWFIGLYGKLPFFWNMFILKVSSQ